MKFDYSNFLMYISVTGFVVFCGIVGFICIVWLVRLTFGNVI